MSAAEIVARIRRLEQLTRGLAKEMQLVDKMKGLQYRERRDYLSMRCAGCGSDWKMRGSCW
jgi:hypothetical protein